MYSKTEKVLARIEKGEDMNEYWLHKLCNLTNSRNAETRAKVASLLVNSNEGCEETLYHLTFDKNDIVKLEATDSLCIGKTLMSLQRLKSLCSDKDFYVRYFAIQSYYDVYMKVHVNTKEAEANLRAFYQKCLQKECVKIVKLALYKVLFLSGDSDAMKKIWNVLVDAITEKNNSLITPAINILEEIIEKPLEEDVKKYGEYVLDEVNAEQAERLKFILT